MHRLYHVLLVTLLIMFCTSATLFAQSTFWYSRVEIEDRNHLPKQAPTTGEYDVWLFLEHNTSGALTLNESSFRMSGKSGPTGQYHWINPGSVTLTAGEYIRPGMPEDNNTVAAMALSTVPNFDPTHAWSLSRIFDQTPDAVPDARLTPTRHTDARYHMPAYDTREDWENHRAYLRNRILTATGQLPTPNKTPLNAQIFGRVEHSDYVTSRVLFESAPGMYVTANLYEPKGVQADGGQYPAILNPHGHWTEGRLSDSETGSVPTRCINYAKRGYVALAWDMTGWSENWQFPHRLVSQRNDLWAINPFNVQTLNTVRALDFLLTLPNVDPERIGITGASGGGTQTFILTAMDDRIAAAAPVNMISSIMQGGCICENTANLRTITNNMEIGAMFAPKPMFMMSTSGDWTRQTLEVEYPAIRHIYGLYGAADKVRSVRQNAPHNYNQWSREHIYAWMDRWLQNEPDAMREPELRATFDVAGELAIFPYAPKPANAKSVEDIVDAHISRAMTLREQHTPVDYPALQRIRNNYSPALAHSIAAEMPDGTDLQIELTGVVESKNCTVRKLIISRAGEYDALPATLWLPNDAPDNGPATLVVHPAGKQALLNAAGDGPGTLVTNLLAQGHRVLTPDVFLTGEYRSLITPTDRSYPKSVGRSEHFTTFNYTDDACRVQDILTAVSYLRRRGDVTSINIAGLGDAGVWTLMARSQVQDIHRTIIDINGFDNTDDLHWLTQCNIPGIRNAGDTDAAAAVIAPGRLYLHNTAGQFQADWFDAAYAAAGEPDNLQVLSSGLTEKEIGDWLTTTPLE